MKEFRTRVDLDVEPSLAAVEHAAELWGAVWRRSGTGGRLELPVQAGLRQGVVTATVSTEVVSGTGAGNGAGDGADRAADTDTGDSTTLVVRIESSDYHLQTGAVTILGIGGLGCLPLILWPLYPKLLALAPVSLILIVVAWLVVASRLQNSGVEEFLDMVAGRDSKR